MATEPKQDAADPELDELERMLAEGETEEVHEEVPEAVAEVIEDAAAALEREVAAELAELEQDAVRDQAELGACVAKILELTDPAKQLSARVKLAELRAVGKRIESWMQNGRWP